MKKHIIIVSILALLCIDSIAAAGQEQSIENRYRRSSICSMLIKHTEDKYADEIEEQFLNIPVPDQYNDHNLSVRVVSVNKKGKYQDDITDFVERNQIGSRLVGKWFDRNILTGECSMDTIKARGLYDASVFDHEMAKRTARGKAMLEDAGEDLIGNTYLLVNEITYIDKNKRARLWGAIGSALVMGLGAASGVDMNSTAQNLNDIVSSLKGFSVKIHTRLYRLNWDESTAGYFYNDYYTSKPDDSRRLAFEQNRSRFRMEYIGDVVSKGGSTSFLGINEQEPYLMIRKACQRAIDDNVADLQKKYEQFRIKAPIVSVEPTITVQIGLKEGITKDSKFEVLEPQEKDGKISYKRVAVIKPVASRIWDNRFMAQEELAYGADFGATTFTKESGGDIYPGLLVREIQ